MASSRSQPVWAAVGQVSALIGLVIGAVSVYRMFWPDAAAVQASCRYASTPWPVRLSPEPPTLSPKAREQATSETASRLKHLKPDEAAELADRIVSDVLSTGRLDWSRPEIPAGVLTCSVENSGSKPASDVVLHIPFEVTDVDLGPDRQVDQIKGGHVRLGEIHPDSSVSVAVWARYSWSPILGGLRLSHSAGRGVVRMPSEAWGWRALLANYPVMLGLAVVWLLWVVSTYPGRGSASAKTPPPAPEASSRRGGAAEQGDEADER